MQINRTFFESGQMVEGDGGNMGYREIIRPVQPPQMAANVRNDPFYYGDNEVVYEQQYYTNPMNGGLISKSSRNPNMVANLVPIRPVLEQKPPEERLAMVEEVTYYDNYSNRNVQKVQPEVAVEAASPPELEDVYIEEIYEAPTPIAEPEPELIIEEVELEEESVFDELPVEEEESIATKEVEINSIKPVTVPQTMIVELPEPTVITPAYIVQKQPDTLRPVSVAQRIVNTIKPVTVVQEEPPAPESVPTPQPEIIARVIENRVEIHDQPIIEVIEQPIVEVIERPPIYVERMVDNPQDVPYYYGQTDFDRERKDITTEAEILSQIKRGPRRVISQPKINFQPPENVEVREKWEKVLEDEQAIVSKLNTLYEEDLELQKRIKDSETDIQKSEMQYTKAKQEIDKTIHDSENRMAILEKKLSELYLARDMALKARENLYKP